MPDLEDLLAAEAARYDVRQPPVAQIRRRRQRRVLARAGGALAAVALLGAAWLAVPGLDRGRDAAVANGPTATEQDRPRIEGMRTDPDGLALVAAYHGGACDGPDALLVEESDDRIDVAIQVLLRPGDDRNTPCPAIGIGRTVRADLARPLGKRDVYSGGQRIEPYDGAELVVPSRLPAGLVLGAETGTADAWTRTYGPPRHNGLVAPCRPGERSLSVSTGPRVLAAFSAPDFDDDGTVMAGGAPARLYSQGKAPVRYLALEVDGRPVSLSYSTACGGPAPSVQELVDIAEGLRPARP